MVVSSVSRGMFSQERTYIYTVWPSTNLALRAVPARRDGHVVFDSDTRLVDDSSKSAEHGDHRDYKVAGCRYIVRFM